MDGWMKKKFVRDVGIQKEEEREQTARNMRYTTVAMQNRLRTQPRNAHSNRKVREYSLYLLRVNVGGDQSRRLLRACATTDKREYIVRIAGTAILEGGGSCKGWG